MAVIVNLIWLLLKTFGKILIAAATLVILLLIAINLFTILSTMGDIEAAGNINAETVSVDTPILVLGAGVINNAYPSHILANRLDMAYEVHLRLPNHPIIVSGDHREDTYNEVGVMKDYLIDLGVPSSQIYQDHAGHSTYDSLYRLKEIIGAEEVIIVTQRYHLFRAMMIGEGLGMTVTGIAAEEIQSSRFHREMREFFARVKDFAVVYLGYELTLPLEDYGFSLEESGDLTDDKNKL